MYLNEQKRIKSLFRTKQPNLLKVQFIGEICNCIHV